MSRSLCYLSSNVTARIPLQPQCAHWGSFPSGEAIAPAALNFKLQFTLPSEKPRPDGRGFVQLTFTTIFGAFAITNAATAVRMISGTMYIPLYTALYTQPSAAGLRLATIC